jgi:hypothetical protein
MQARPLAAFILLVVALSPGCGSSSPSAPTPGVIVGPIQVDSLEIVHNASSPSGLGVRVQGVIGDGCTDLLPPITQERDGTVVRIRILRQRPEEAICIQIAKLFDQVVPLLGDYPAGEYVVHVNASDLTFRVP